MEIIIILGSISILQFLSSIWIKSRLENSIRLENDKVLEEFRYDIRIREQASKIAEYIAFIEEDRINPPEKPDYRYMNKLAFELLLWLPEDLYLELKEVFSKNDIENNTFKVLVKIREHLQKKKTLITDNDIFWHIDRNKKANLSISEKSL